MKTIILLFLLGIQFIYSQSEKDSIQLIMINALMYPGCEESESQFERLQCFLIKLGDETRKKMNTNFELNNGERLRYFVSFSIDSKGMIDLDSITNNNNDLRLVRYVYHAFSQFQDEINYLTEQGKGIKFLNNFDSNGVKLNFILPIGFEGTYVENKKNRKKSKRKNK